MSLLDFLFPKRCVKCQKIGSYVCSDCFTKLSFTTHEICVVCNKASLDGLTHPVCRGKYRIDGVFTSVVYNFMMKRLIAQFKFQPYVTDLQELLSDIFYEGIIQKEAFIHVLERKPILVPIPLSREKQRKRGYNQASLLAEGLSKRLHLPVIAMLDRVKRTETQVGKTREERQKNIRDAFVIKKGNASFVSATVFLVDDVLTSGATVAEAARVLKHNGAKEAYGLALAHGQ